MSSSFEKSVKGATKIKLAPPKSKYVEHILQATRTGETGVAEVFRILQLRIQDSTWTIAFKALIVVHLMIREGEPNATLAYLSNQPRRVLGTAQYSDRKTELYYCPRHGQIVLLIPTAVQTQGRNIRNYSLYLAERARSFQKAKCDYVIRGNGRLKRLTLDKGLLRETELVQDSIQALLQCDFMTEEMDNEISLTAYRLVTMDLLALYQVMNEGTMNVLEHYFYMSRPDAERALGIYKSFTRLTDLVIRFLTVARQHSQATRLEIPKLKHAPTSLTSALEDYLKDPDFETNRRQYLAQEEAKRGGKPGATASSSKPSSKAASAPTVATPAKSTAAPSQPKPAPDLIDFFSSIEDNQQTMAEQPTAYQQAPFPQYQQPAGFPQQQTGFTQQQPTGFGQDSHFASQQTTGFSPQGTNPFAQFQQQQPSPQQQQPLQTQFTGAGFGGYTPQAEPQQQFHAHEMLPQQQSPQSPSANQYPGGLQRQQTNPFRQSTLPSQISQGGNPFGQPGQGTNPFGRINTMAIPEQGAIESFSPPPFSPPQSQSPFGQQQAFQSPHQNSLPQQTQPIAPQQTGTNPFARSQPSSPPPQGALQTQATGTNPFKNAAFVNQSTGQGWQNGPQGTFGGINAQGIDSVSVFPRPAGQQQPQQQAWM